MIVKLKTYWKVLTLLLSVFVLANISPRSSDLALAQNADPCPTPILCITPASVTTTEGGQVTSSVAVGDFSDTSTQSDPPTSGIYGIEFRLSFNPDIVGVVDADPEMSGVQIGVGSLFAESDNFIINMVNNEDGVIDFTASLRDPAPPITQAGIVASITWLGKNAGRSDITFESFKLTDRNGRPIAAEAPQNGEVIVGVKEPSGQVWLQGRSDHSGTDIILTEEACPLEVTGSNLPDTIAETTTDEDGNFNFSDLPANRTYRCLQAIYPGYLVGQVDLTQATPDAFTITLLGGDVTADDMIDIFDLAYIASRYKGDDLTADINGDGLVDIGDLAITGGNYNQTGPITTWEVISP